MRFTTRRIVGMIARTASTLLKFLICFSLSIFPAYPKNQILRRHFGIKVKPFQAFRLSVGGDKANWINECPIVIILGWPKPALFHRDHSIILLEEKTYGSFQRKGTIGIKSLFGLNASARSPERIVNKIGRVIYGQPHSPGHPI